MFQSPKEPIIQPLELPGASDSNIKIDIMREDLTTGSIAGNKYWKLKYNVETALNEGYSHIISFGGAYSNHLLALAQACRDLAIPAVGIVRGEEPNTLSTTLEKCLKLGMDLRFVSRSTFKKIYEEKTAFQIPPDYPNPYIIPLGGSNRLAVKGCVELGARIPGGYDFLCVPLGTGGTAAGMICSIIYDTTLLIFPVLKGIQAEKLITGLIRESGFNPCCTYQIRQGFELGGFAKCTSVQLQLLEWIWETQNIPFDAIYTGKVVFALHHLLKQGAFPPDSRILLVQTGGLQGNAGINKRYGSSLPE